MNLPKVTLHYLTINKLALAEDNSDAFLSCNLNILIIIFNLLLAHTIGP